MVQVFGETVADLVAPSPFSHSFRNASDYSRAPIAQRNDRQNFPGYNDWLIPIGSSAGDLDAIVKLLLAGKLGLQVHLGDVQGRLPLAHHEAARMLAAVAIHRDAR